MIESGEESRPLYLRGGVGTVDAMGKARAALMLVHAYREEGSWQKALMSAVSAKVGLEEAMGTVETVEYATALHLQATCASILGQHDVAAQLLLYASKLMVKRAPLLSRRMRHLGAVELAQHGKHDDAVHELKQLAYELERDDSVDEASVSLTRCNMGRVLLLALKFDEAIPLLQDAVVQLNSRLGRAHRFSQRAERLWATCELEPRPSTWSADIVAELKETLPL